MEENNQHEKEAYTQISIAQPEALSLELIRTETVLSRLPVHNLAKQGRVNIQIIKTTPSGEVELKWEVSYSDRYGQARQLAYRLDTIIINQRIDEAGRPLPKILRIGSLNEICGELNLATHAGENAKDLKRAFLQNASAFITAKFNYRANDGTERHVEAGVTRYGVIFTGEKLPDGRRADAVYITFNDPFWEVLNNAPVRPLDRAYMKGLPPAAQRFYEIISRKIFAALKNNYPRAKISYSEYCTFSAQLQHHERQRVQDQMAKVLRPHKTSGYITAVKYEPIINEQNQPDWMMYLTPGPRAFAEFAAAHGGRKIKKTLTTDTAEAGDRQSHHRRTALVEVRSQSEHIPPPTFDPQLVAEFTRRGIAERKASDLLAHLKPGQDVVAQLELVDNLVKNARIPITNPPGFYVRMIESNTSIPDNFETSAKRYAREERERRERERRAEEDARQLLESEYDNYCATETDRYLEEYPAEFEALKTTKWRENRDRYQAFPEDMITTISANEARREMQKQMSLLTFEEFVHRKKQGIDFSLKLVALSAVAETPPVEPASQEVAFDGEPVVAPADLPATAHNNEPATAAILEVEPATPESGKAATDPIPAIQSAIPEAIKIEPADNPLPPPEVDGNSPEPGLV